MNLELSEAFCQNYPEQLDGRLDSTSYALTLCFNKRGTLLAVGCNDGRIVIWDFATRTIAKIISAHVHPVCCLSWSRSGMKLLSSSTDNNVCIWDVMTASCLIKHRFPCPTLFVQFDPKNEMHFIACPMYHPPLVLDNKGGHMILPLGEDNDQKLFAVFDRKGRYIIMGNSRGTIMVLDAANWNFVTKFKIVPGISSWVSVKSIEFARKGGYFLVNCSDRVIRVYCLKEVLKNTHIDVIEPQIKLQDSINRSMWKKSTFSGDGEYICAGSDVQNAIYIWERRSGSLVKILHGCMVESFLDAVWHPGKSVIASIGSGMISVWAQTPQATWSAFAPNFKELDENVEYEERESEFDMADEDKSVIGSEKEIHEDVDVDIMTVGPTTDGSSDEESDHVELDILPAVPEIENPEEVEKRVRKQRAPRRPRMPPPPPPPAAVRPKPKPELDYPRIIPVESPNNNGLKLRIKLGNYSSQHYE
ncbi:retinoblastoma-binding protein 5 homolog [Ctenocephalides felis]|uniref:retinoblastoma-binding protein 5 homolog n=1 Tax=Ctenocephalides felis TaxID=7515 RepID=UPI000E6E2432|nr:retinoblastoma-binding protein 5 homolog [Ctenocephalides felis]